MGVPRCSCTRYPNRRGRALLEVDLQRRLTRVLEKTVDGQAGLPYVWALGRHASPGRLGCLSYGLST